MYSAAAGRDSIAGQTGPAQAWSKASTIISVVGRGAVDRVPAPAAVVLAGGASRRMGRDKATMPHPDGGSMLEHTLAVLAQRCAPAFVVAAPGQQLPDLDGIGRVEVLRDEVPGLGPLAATGLGLRAAAGAGSARAFVCAVDMPCLDPGVVDELAQHFDPEIVLAWDGRDHYLAGIYRTGLAIGIEALVADGARSMRALTDSADTHRVVLGERAAVALANVNSPGDLENLKWTCEKPADPDSPDRDR